MRRLITVLNGLLLFAIAACSSPEAAAPVTITEPGPTVTSRAPTETVTVTVTATPESTNNADACRTFRNDLQIAGLDTALDSNSIYAIALTMPLERFATSPTSPGASDGVIAASIAQFVAAAVTLDGYLFTQYPEHQTDLLITAYVDAKSACAALGAWR